MFKKLTDSKFMQAFEGINDEKQAKAFFVELFKNRDFTIIPEADLRFRSIAAAVLPGLLAQTVQLKKFYYPTSMRSVSFCACLITEIFLPYTRISAGRGRVL